jgi:hypothetical protein
MRARVPMPVESRLSLTSLCHPQMGSGCRGGKGCGRRSDEPARTKRYRVSVVAIWQRGKLPVCCSKWVETGPLKVHVS